MKCIITIRDYIVQWQLGQRLVVAIITIVFAAFMVTGIQSPDSWKLGILANSYPMPNEAASIR